MAEDKIAIYINWTEKTVSFSQDTELNLLETKKSSTPKSLLLGQLLAPRIKELMDMSDDALHEAALIQFESEMP